MNKMEKTALLLTLIIAAAYVGWRELYGQSILGTPQTQADVAAALEATWSGLPAYLSLNRSTAFQGPYALTMTPPNLSTGLEDSNPGNTFFDSLWPNWNTGNQL